MQGRCPTTVLLLWLLFFFLDEFFLLLPQLGLGFLRVMGAAARHRGAGTPRSGSLKRLSTGLLEFLVMLGRHPGLEKSVGVLVCNMEVPTMPGCP